MITVQDRVLGPDHPETLHSRNNLAVYYRDVGRVEAALALHQQVLADRERLLGDDHPETRRSRNNVAVSYQDVGRHEEARMLYERP